MKNSVLTLAIVTAACLGALAGCSNMQMGSSKAKTVATGSAGGANSQNANADLEHCGTPLGTIAVVEDSSAPWYGALTGQMHLGSTVPVLKLIIQQSNCFLVVERGQGLRNREQERALAAGGQARAGSNIGGGQMVAADFILTPAVVFSEGNAGGVGGAAAQVTRRRH